MNGTFTIEELQQLMKCVAENHLGELLLENGDSKLRIRNAGASTVSLGTPVLTVPSAVSSVCESEVVSQPPKGTFLTAPIVGTFYAAPSPDKEPFVKVGQSIQKGETVFIIESMKVMNEVPAESSGVVAEILVENGAPVEYGQPILRLE